MKLMHALYDATILLSVGLATVVGAVYAVAATFLGRALTRARQDEADEAEKRAAEYEALIENIKSSSTVSEISKQTSKATRDYRWRQLVRLLVAMSRGPQLLPVIHSVLIPGFFFLTAMILTARAKLFTPVDQTGWEPSAWWWAALTALLLGLWRLVSVLRAVESIGGASEASYFREQTAAFREALDQRDRDLQPKFELTIRGEVQLPVGAEESLSLRLACVSGGAAHKVEVYLHLPEGFDFVDRPLTYTDDLGRRGAMVLEVGTLASGLRKDFAVRIRTRDQPGEYDLNYIIACDEVTFQDRHFRIILSQSSPPPAATNKPGDMPL